MASSLSSSSSLSYLSLSTSTPPTEATIQDYVTHILSQIDTLRGWPVTLFPILSSYYYAPSRIPSLYMFPMNSKSVAVVPFMPHMRLSSPITNEAADSNLRGSQWRGVSSKANRVHRSYDIGFGNMLFFVSNYQH
jgi:hypothetical protein